MVVESKRFDMAAEGVAWLAVRIDRPAGRIGRFVGRIDDPELALLLSWSEVVAARPTTY